MSELRDKVATICQKWMQKYADGNDGNKCLAADEVINICMDAAIEKIKDSTQHISVCRHYFYAVEESIESLKNDSTNT